MKSRFGIIPLAVLTAFVLSPSVPADTRYVLITILHTNDLHGQVVPRDVSGGLARAATLVRRVRDQMPNVLLLDAGDIIHGTPEDYFSAGRATISAMNAVAYQAATTGNHEYDFGLDTLKAAALFARFPFLAANVRAASGGQWDSVAPCVVFTMDGVRVAVVGLTTMQTVTLHWPGSIKDIVVEDPMSTAANLVPQLRDESDVLVVLSHLGADLDEELAHKVPGIDFIVGGHSHTCITDWRWVGDTLITQTGAYARLLGRIDFIVRLAQAGARICLLYTSPSPRDRS